ncbi:phosphatidate cytidylyltransferase [Flavobacterium sp.]|uniref:phosphatidate cytidylyltransferase n=1 Tax=Flavobacterium sp. TaxID=239 RepID=UPI00262BFC0E|nr:phosphatidate cytidylyltransferase [Flavobacterium sp.]
MKESIVRALSGIVYILVLVSATFFSEVTFVLLFAFFMLIAITEFCRLINYKPITPYIIAAVLLAVFIYAEDYRVHLTNIFVVVSVIVNSILLYQLFNKRPPRALTRTLKLVKLIGYIILPFLLIMRLPYLTKCAGGFIFVPDFIISIFILIWINDTFAYITGKTFGKHKLFERISPKKTVEGFAGGMVFTIAGAVVLSIYLKIFGLPHWIATGIIVVIFGTLGDLVESRFKRLAGVKDSGSIMPGHGGILDRLDSIIFAIPFLFLYYQIINYVS